MSANPKPELLKVFMPAPLKLALRIYAAKRAEPMNTSVVRAIEEMLRKEESK